MPLHNNNNNNNNNFIYFNWVVTRWQWLLYMYTKYEIVPWRLRQFDECKADGTEETLV